MRQFNGWYDNRWWGAVNDGVTDDTTADEAALNWCAYAGGGTVYVPGATAVTGISLDRAGCTIEGQGGASLGSATQQSAIVYIGNTTTASFTGTIVPSGLGCGGTIAQSCMTVSSVTGSLSSAIGSSTNFVFSKTDPAQGYLGTGPTITSQISGTAGGVGSYRLSQSFTDATATFTGAISTTTLTVSAITQGSIQIGQLVVGAGVTAGTKVTAFGNGRGGTGTYTLSASSSVSSEAMVQDEPMTATDSASLADSAAFQGSVSGTTLTVDAITSGTIVPSVTPLLQGPYFPNPVLPGTTIISQYFGGGHSGDTPGGNGVYLVSQSQTVTPQPMVTGPLTPAVLLQDASRMGLENIQVLPGATAWNAVAVEILDTEVSVTEQTVLRNVWIGYNPRAVPGQLFQQGVWLQGGAASQQHLDNVRVYTCIDAGIYNDMPDNTLSNVAPGDCAVGIRFGAPALVVGGEFGGNTVADLQSNGGGYITVLNSSSQASTRFFQGLGTYAVNLTVIGGSVDPDAGYVRSGPVDGYWINVGNGNQNVVMLQNLSFYNEHNTVAPPYSILAENVLSATGSYTTVYQNGTYNIGPPAVSTVQPGEAQSLIYQPAQIGVTPLPWQIEQFNPDEEHSGDNTHQPWRNDFAGKLNNYGGPFYVDALSPPSGLAARPTCSGTCATTYTYEVVARTYDGTTQPTSAVTCTNAASLSSSNSCALTWYGELGAKDYQIFGRVNGSLGLLATIPAGTAANAYPTWTDTGSRSPGAAPPSNNTTGSAYVDGSITATRGVVLPGSSSGSTALNAAASAGGTATLPANTGTIAELNLSQSFTAGQAVTPYVDGTQSAGGTLRMDFGASNYHTARFGNGNLTIADPSNVKAGECGWLALTQDSVGNRTAAWGADWKWSGGIAPTLSAGANDTDLITWCVISSSVIAARLSIANYR